MMFISLVDSFDESPFMIVKEYLFLSIESLIFVFGSLLRVRHPDSGLIP